MPGEAGTTLIDASVSAFLNYTKTFNWTIDKTVTPDTWELFTGDTGTSQYSVTVTKDAGTVSATITGQVCVTNGPDIPTEGLAITVELLKLGGGPPQTIVPPQPVDVSGNPVLSPNERGCYDYSIAIPSDQMTPGNTFKVTAHITITNHSGCIDPPKLCGPSPSSSDLVFPSTPTLVHNSIDVIDDNGPDYFGITGTTTFPPYTRTFTCADEATNPNTNKATIIYEGNESGPSDSADVTVHCYSLSVNKTVNTSYDRIYSWTINKQISSESSTSGYADTASFTLNIGDSHQVYYRVILTPTETDNNYMASGTITIGNPAPTRVAVITSVTDSISGIPGIIPVDCGIGSFPLFLAAGGTHNCFYETLPGQLPDKSARTNTATVTIQNYNYSYDGSFVPAGTTSFNDSEPVTFSSTPTQLIDETVSVSDVPYGFVGTVTVDPNNPTSQILYYPSNNPPATPIYIGPYSTCGDYTVTNTATFTANDTGATGSDTATAYVSVPCATGCTHTIGYWKTHAGFGPQDDEVTQYLPIWLGTPFTPPPVLKSKKIETAAQAVEALNFYYNASNGINKLYGQLLAAKLNIADGANGSVISSIIAAADAFLATHNSADWVGLSRTLKNQVNSWASTLDNYNNGLLGVPHCTESGEEEPEIPGEEPIEVTEGLYTINININNSSNFKVVIDSKEDCTNQEG